MTSQVSMNGGKKPGSKKVGHTLRFDLNLAPPTDDNTNEFSYVHLVKDKCKEKSSSSTGPSIAPDDPLSSSKLGEDEELAAIAKRLEEKYGPGPKKRKRVLHESDLIDRGLGYDLADSFVDDTELYENYVPHQLDTRFGGFYINTGRLEFKPAEDLGDEDELDFVSDKKHKKPAVKKLPSFQSTPQAILANQKLKKAKRAALQKHPTPLKKTHSAALGTGAVNTIKPPATKKLKLTAATAQSSAKQVVLLDSTSQSSPSLLAGLDTTTPPSSLAGAIPVIQTVNLSSKLSKSSGTGAKPSIPPGADSKSSADSATGAGEQVVKEPPVIPDKLPSAVLEKVTNLEQLILQDQDASGKLSLKARLSYDQHLVDIHVSCHGISKKMRNSVFEYLAYRMGVARGTLIKRINQELRKKEDTELEKYIVALKQAIDASMPEQIELYEKEVRARAESMSEAAAPAVEEEMKVDDVFDDTTNASTTQLPSGSQPGADKAKKPPIIRKRFKWTEEIKKLLCAAVKVKVACEERANKMPKANAEETIMTFLEEKIKPLWPKGWMQKSVLYKASEVAHKHFTNPLAKKALTAKKDKPLAVLLAKKEPTPLTATQTLPNNTHPSTTTTSQAPQITSDSTKLASLNKNFITLKKELDSIKLASEGLQAGGVSLGSSKTTVISASAVKGQAGTSTLVANSSIPKITLVKGSGAQKPQKRLSQSVKTVYVKPPSSSNCRVAPAKSAKPVTSLSLSGIRSSSASSSSVPTTYILPADDIAKLLQAHLQKKQQQSTAGGSVQIPVLSSVAQHKAPATTQLVFTTGAAVNKQGVITSATRSPKLSQGLATIMSGAHGTKVTPALAAHAPKPAVVNSITQASSTGQGRTPVQGMTPVQGKTSTVPKPASTIKKQDQGAPKPATIVPQVPRLVASSSKQDSIVLQVPQLLSAVTKQEIKTPAPKPATPSKLESVVKGLKPVEDTHTQASLPPPPLSKQEQEPKLVATIEQAHHVASSRGGGMSNVLPRLPSLSSSATDTSKLESVVSKIVSAAIGSKSLTLPKPPDSPTPPGAAHSSSPVPRLHLVKKGEMSPRVILPEWSHEPKVSPSVVGSGLDTPTKTLPPVTSVVQVPATPGVGDGYLSTTTAVGYGGLSNTPAQGRDSIPTSLHTPNTPTFVASQLSVLPPGSTGSVKVVPDTPPQSLPVMSAAVNSPQSHIMVVGDSPLSPLRSPVEQIFEEHSYPESNRFTTNTETEKE